MTGEKQDEYVRGVKNSVRIDHLEDSDERQWDAIDALRNRPPTWTTIVLTIMGIVIGALATLVAR